MKYNVCIVTGTRAEYGLLQPLIKKLNDDDALNLQLVVTGSHLCADFGNTQTEIEASGIPIKAKIYISLVGDTKVDMIKAIAEAMSSFANYFSANRPDLLVVLGDRYEIFAASTAAAMLGIPIAHIHGGETTEGAVDEFLRHSISKMSTIHFTACEQYKKRVIQLGESPERVFNVGALGVENIMNLPEIPIRKLSDYLKMNIDGRPYGLVIFHPVTQEQGTGEKQVKELIKALDVFIDMNFIIIKSNADAGGRLINHIWEEEAKKHNNWVLVSSMQSQYYLTALKHAAVMIGNSSSGIIEAPSLHTPSVNIGDRQKGRLMADSIICCEPCSEKIIMAIKKAMTPEFMKIAIETENPYGSGNTSGKILNLIKEFLLCNKIDTKKKFYDVRIED